MFKYCENNIIREERKIFFQTWLQSPLQLGTFAPISQKLADKACSFVSCEGPIVEVGAGTGRLTRALLKKGMPKDFAVVEIDEKFCSFLKKTLNLEHPFQGDARHLNNMIPNDWIGNIKTIISVIPFMYFSKEERDEILKGLFKCLHPKGSIIHVTYSPFSPFSHRSDIKQILELSMWCHFPPSFIWRYQPFCEKNRNNM